MNGFAPIRFAVQQKDAFNSVISNLGSLLGECIYIVLAILIGINLFRRGTYYQMVKHAGEENKISGQAANVLGTLIYAVIVIILLPLAKVVGRIFFRE